jgi:uncharacterized membrane protein YcaP (DUF421 family)
MAARALLMYLLLVVIVRSAKKRFLSNATAFDFILTVVIGSVAARAMTGGAPFFQRHSPSLKWCLSTGCSPGLGSNRPRLAG